MTANIADAVAAYSNAAKGLGAPGLEARPASAGPSFGELLREAEDSVVAAGKQGEGMSLKAVQGKADLAEVVAAVSNAEVTLQTVVAVRDRVIQAYQDILRMPI